MFINAHFYSTNQPESFGQDYIGCLTKLPKILKEITVEFDDNGQPIRISIFHKDNFVKLIRKLRGLEDGDFSRRPT